MQAGCLPHRSGRGRSPSHGGHPAEAAAAQYSKAGSIPAAAACYTAPRARFTRFPLCHRSQVWELLGKFLVNASFATEAGYPLDLPAKIPYTSMEPNLADGWVPPVCFLTISSCNLLLVGFAAGGSQFIWFTLLDPSLAGGWAPVAFKQLRLRFLDSSYSSRHRISLTHEISSEFLPISFQSVLVFNLNQQLSQPRDGSDLLPAANEDGSADGQALLCLHLICRCHAPHAASNIAWFLPPETKTADGQAP